MACVWWDVKTYSINQRLTVTSASTAWCPTLQLAGLAGGVTVARRRLVVKQTTHVVLHHRPVITTAFSVSVSHIECMLLSPCDHVPQRSALIGCNQFCSSIIGPHNSILISPPTSITFPKISCNNCTAQMCGPDLRDLYYNT